jgi:hypothetical protein
MGEDDLAEGGYAGSAVVEDAAAAIIEWLL